MSSWDRLTGRERQVVALLAQHGESNLVLARRMGVAEQTVKFHLSNAMRKADVPTRTGLALWWIRYGRYHDRV